MNFHIARKIEIDARHRILHSTSVCRLRLIFESNKSFVRTLLFFVACIGRVTCVATASKYTERVFQANFRSMGNLKSHTQPRIGTSLTCPGLASSMAVRISPIEFCTRGHAVDIRTMIANLLPVRFC